MAKQCWSDTDKVEGVRASSKTTSSGFCAKPQVSQIHYPPHPNALMMMLVVVLTMMVLVVMLVMLIILQLHQLLANQNNMAVGALLGAAKNDGNLEGETIGS